MVEIYNNGSNIKLENVKVVICSSGKIYIDFPNATRGNQYFDFKTDKIEKDELDLICKKFNEWNQESEDYESNC